MERKYRLASVLLSAGLIMSACGDGEESGGNSGSGGAATEETSEDTDTTESVGDGGDSGESSGGDSSAVNEGSSEDDSESESSGTSDGSSDTITPDTISHDASEAVGAASENFEGELVQVELDNEDDQWVYKVDLESEDEEYEVKLSVDDLSIVNEETESDDDNDTEDQFNYADAVPAEEAVQTALDEAGGEIENWELAKDDGQLEYDIELKNTESDGDADIKINAESGEITETDDEEDDD